MQTISNAKAIQHSWFGSGGLIKKLVIFDKNEDLSAFIKHNTIPFTLLGNCTNTLISDQGLELAIKLKTQEITLLKDNKIYTQSGVPTTKLMRFCIQKGIGGLEFTQTIPGMIGGLLFMNAGAHGKEMKDVVESVDIMDEKGAIYTHTIDQMQYKYRSSKIPTGHIILGATLKGHSDIPENIQKTLNQLQEQRKKTQPLSVKTLGCTFKNPTIDGIKQSAGKIIDECGLKGLEQGGARISPMHGNFIENFNNAQSSDFLKLVEKIQKIVKEKTGIQLEKEIRII